MKKNIVADTNVWYDIANGNINILTEIKKHGRLCATPINLLEIASKIDENNFEIRKNAAKAVLHHADRFLQSNEWYLERYWGFGTVDDIDWKQGFITISKANSPTALQEGFRDLENSVRRKQNTPLLLEWRTLQYADFKSSVVKAVKEILPGYIRETPNGIKMARLTNPNDMAFFDSKEFEDATLSAIYFRMKLGFNLENKNCNCPKDLNHKLRMIGMQKLGPYVRAYAQYLKYLATQQAKPDENDLGDHEAFMYLQDKNWILATADKRWINIANIVCPKQLIDLLPLK